MCVSHRGLGSKSEYFLGLKLIRTRLFRAASSWDDAPDSFTAYCYYQACRAKICSVSFNIDQSEHSWESGNDESDRSTVAHSSKQWSAAAFLEMYCACTHDGYKLINTTYTRGRTLKILIDTHTCNTNGIRTYLLGLWLLENKTYIISSLHKA